MTREKVIPEMSEIQMMRQISRTMVIRIKRDQDEAECKGNVETIEEDIKTYTRA